MPGLVVCCCCQRSRHCCFKLVQKTDPEHQERFKLVTAAYEVLSDPEKRQMHDLGGDPLRANGGASQQGPFDFGDRAFVPVIRAETPALIADRATWHVPDVEALFVQRKVSGTALLGARLKARVDVTGLAGSILRGGAISSSITH